MTLNPETVNGDSNSLDGKGPASLDGELEQAASYVKMLNRWPRHKQICICGHTLNSHHYSAATNRYSCEPANFYCACAEEEPVYFASDARWFKRSTHGVGKKHALVLGIASLIDKGGSGEWLVPPQCQVRDCPGLEISIACVDRTSRIVPHTTERSVLLCKGHIASLGGTF